MKLRHKLISWLLTDDEKYMVIRAIDDRIEKLRSVALNERWAIDNGKIKDDMGFYRDFRWLFSTKNWK